MKARFFEVGGAVRDRLMGLKPKDMDYAVETDSFDSMREAIKGLGGEIFLETPQYFTIRAKVPSLGAADYVLCRKDGVYKDGRHPESVTVGTIYDDLARRDFTVNAIARDCQTGEIYDPHNGQADIKSCVLRFVGNPEDRLNEDKLRAFRALRFEVTKNLFLETPTANAIHALTSPSHFENVSTERIREELVKMFAADSAYSFHLLFRTFPTLGAIVIERKIWFRPTVEQFKPA